MLEMFVILWFVSILIFAYLHASACNDIDREKMHVDRIYVRMQELEARIKQLESPK